MKYAIVITLSFVAAFACHGAPPPKVAPAPKLPHIILVMADDQGWGDMAYNGHPHLKTPNFDRAAAEGLRFDRFYAAAPVCSPTRASVLTGRHPNRMKVFKWGHPMRPQEITLAEALKTAGYTTGHFGKWHLGSVRRKSPANPGNNGFDRWVSAPNYYDNDAVMSDQGTAVQREGESSLIAVDDALEWIREKAGGDAPIFAVVWFGSPHSPHRAIEADRALYDDQSENYQHFYGEITGMDRAFGKLRGALDELGIRENTILWYTSDNGALKRIGDTGGARGHKGKIYDGGLLVPAIFEWPARLESPRTSAVRCNSSDIYPTLLDIVGVKMPGQPPLDGISLLPLIEGKGGVVRPQPMGFWNAPGGGVGMHSDRLLAELLVAQQAGGDLPPDPRSRDAAILPSPKFPLDAFPGHAAWIDGDFKLHRREDHKTGEITLEFYNLTVDPAESNNLIEAEPDRAKAYRTALESWLTSVANSLNGADYQS